ncbi:MAG TPA: IS630 family transposase [Sphaerochaeta sp.]|nr:IS630 family transposase [Sphaerochaeta sp.]
MPRVAKRIECTEEQLEYLNKFANSQKSEKRLIDRARMVLGCAQGRRIKDIAKDLGVLPNTVIKWRERFKAYGMDGLYDAPRSGRPDVYDEKDILVKVGELLKQEPPCGYSSWDGGTLAKKIGCSPDTLWRVLRDNNIVLRRHRLWCQSKESQFSEKATDIVGLYLNPPENAFVISVDEKLSIQAKTQKKSFVREYDRSMVTAVNCTYRRNAPINLFTALSIATGSEMGKMTKYKKREDFLSFMDNLVEVEKKDISESKDFHVIFDNYCTYKRCTQWLEKHPNVHFHYTPTSASWLNMVKIWFNIMSRKELSGASFNSNEEVSEKIREFIDHYDEHPNPFVWRKREVKGAEIRDTIANLLN